MTAHTHDPVSPAGNPRATPGAIAGAKTTAVRPRWLLPGLFIVVAAGALVIAGVLSLSTVIYAGMFGGMILMHLGGHGVHGGGHVAHGDSTPDTENLSARSSGHERPRSELKGEPDDRVSTDRPGNETDDHDQHSSHGCH
jgi:hypothetical protein